LLVTDFDPLKIKRRWKSGVLEDTELGVHEVDAHNIIPCWITSGKQEYAAYTIRPKIHRLLPRYLKEYPTLTKQVSPLEIETVDWSKVYNNLNLDAEVKEIEWLKPGEREALKMMNYFIKEKLGGYTENRNNPAIDALSNLSPYLHFGQLSAQRVALEVKKIKCKNGV